MKETRSEAINKENSNEGLIPILVSVRILNGIELGWRFPDGKVQTCNSSVMAIDNRESY